MIKDDTFNPPLDVLDGNFEKWLVEKRPVTQKVSNIIKSNYIANENVSLVINKDQVNQNIINKKFQLIDARGEKRFKGLEPEPRKELRSGNIEGSINLPFKELINEEFGFGGMFYIDLGTLAKANQLMEEMQKNNIGYLAVSLGFSKTLFSAPGRSTSSEIPEDEQKEMGLSDGIIRFSIGLDQNIERTYQKMVDCMKVVGVL